MVDAFGIIALADLSAVEPEGELLVGGDVQGRLVDDTANIESPAEIARLSRRLAGRIAFVEPDPGDTPALLGLGLRQAGKQTQCKEEQGSDAGGSTKHGGFLVNDYGRQKKWSGHFSI